MRSHLYEAPSCFVIGLRIGTHLALRLQVQGRCTVVSMDEFDRLTAAEKSRDNVFVCRYHYDPNKYSAVLSFLLPRDTSSSSIRRRGLELAMRCARMPMPV